jgi:DNA ligase (NAD+)
MAEKSSENLLFSLEESKEVPFERVLFALGIRYVGETVAKVLCKHFKTIEGIIAADIETLIAVDEIGDKIAESVVFFFSQQKNRDLIVNLEATGLQFTSVFKDTLVSEILKGMKIVISGVFSQFSRVELKNMIEEHGGKNVSSISKNTTFVLSGDNMGLSKRQKATDLGIPLVNEEEFLAKIS